MTTVAIRKKLHQYIDTAQDKKVKAIFAMVEEEIEDESTRWSDEFLNEMDKRTSEFEIGKDKSWSWGDIKKHARKRLKSVNK